jgi:hypothetical protein
MLPVTQVRRLLVVTIVGAMGLFSLDARAQASDPVAARALFREGRKAAEAGDYATACPKFSDSYRLDPAVGTLLNIADCEQRSGHLAAAWVSFQKAMDQLPKDDKRRPAVEKIVAALGKRLPRLSIRLAPAAPHASTVERDGVEVGSSSLGVAVPLDPGRHVVVIRAPGRREQRYDVELTEGQSQELVGEPGREDASAATAPAPQTGTGAGPATSGTSLPVSKPAKNQVGATSTLSTTTAANSLTGNAAQPKPKTGDRSRTAGYVIGGIGAVGFVVGVATRLAAYGQKSTVNERCDPNKLCDETGMDAVSLGKMLQTVSTVSLAVGLVGLGTGIYLVVSSPKSPQKRATLHPLVLPGGAGLTFGRAF